MELENGQERTITIQEVQNYLDKINAPLIEIPVKDIYQMCCHRDKTDPETLARAERSNLDYPIIIAKGEDGRWTMILDGHHRLYKANAHGVEKIKARVLDLSLPGTPEDYKKMFY